MQRFALCVVAVLALALPAAASAHPSVYEVERKTLAEPVGTCNFGENPAGNCFAAGPTRYVVVNHNIPIAYDETNGLGAGDGGVINFTRFPGSFRKTIPTAAGWLQVEPPRTGVQPHATCAATATTDPANVVGWQGAEPFYAYVPWQGTSAGLDDDPADWIGYVKTLTGVDLTGMGAAAAEAACEGLPGATPTSYRSADTPLVTSIASGLVAHEVEHAVAPLQGEIDRLLGAQHGLQGQIDAWRTKAASLEATVGGLDGQLAGARQANARLQRANAKKAKTIERLRKRLAARADG